MNDTANVAVLGAGAFGTALAAVVAARGNAVSLIGRDALQMEKIRTGGTNEKALPGVKLPASLIPSAEPRALSSADLILLAVPAQNLRQALQDTRNHIPGHACLVVCAKGIERKSGQFLADVVRQESPDNPVAVLSGPGFATDIASGLPTAMTLAASDMDVAKKAARQLSGNTFRLYASTDVIGVEIGGSLKNVLAIACGIVEGRGLGESARAALIARGLAELMRFAEAHGGERETIRGLSGLGDLVLTATSHQSRNLRFGIALGEGRTTAELMAPGTPLSEGAFTAGVAARISMEKNIDMPITQAVAAILDGKIAVDEAIDGLMNRPLKSE
ncbi:NAD(P)H-dependent glycerol-3-phosphate dehydrogenase [Hoeflea prorocentri]|uniref:Glycerol-3-phosphate dehydrogenase [NAD(P)+] n=1 Tax=Hoeflea prorocentri TaxID=1922333 RepID=A0A9X3UMC7_9HYPH|nr:NAD(P)H-dependent glycerol-3-phosphate dehydrogenase [Hoeflea prorocentri]MCY6383302.1 NAD(P)-dependent glycerol-3-phosphate dehydrogenase [Hoeflea prorocentri]MDA5401102.1 NAD(P)-dependent glycerol-3-phosphate dehydrogenase [Hoeflea prorocentri]